MIILTLWNIGDVAQILLTKLGAAPNVLFPKPLGLQFPTVAVMTSIVCVVEPAATNKGVQVLLPLP